MLALTFYTQLLLITTGVVFAKSQPKNNGILPKRYLSLSLISLIVQFVLAKQCLYCIKSSFQIISVVIFSKPVSIDCFGIRHLLCLLISIGILNVVWDVFPSRKSNTTRLKETPQRTIIFCV